MFVKGPQVRSVPLTSGHRGLGLGDVDHLSPVGEGQPTRQAWVLPGDRLEAREVTRSRDL